MSSFQIPVSLNRAGVVVRRLARTASGLIFPDQCLSCGAYIQISENQTLDACFCDHCASDPLPLFQPPFCPVCGHLFAARDQASHLCGACLNTRPLITKVRAAFVYDGRVKTAVSQLKYTRRMKLSSPLGRHLYEAFERHWQQDDIDIVLPVPLHKARAWDRGFNQAWVLVRKFPAYFRAETGARPPWSLEPAMLYRKRATLSQTGLNQEDRKANLKGAFGLRREDRGRGKQVLLVDDVYTSGATCRAAAAVLQKAGAARVDALVLARA